MLIVLSGLPGVGKTTIAREAARRLPAVHVRIDSIEDAIRASSLAPRPMDDAGYRVGYALAEDNLRLGHLVIADSVNPLPMTRHAWRQAAHRAEVAVIDVEIICSAQHEHRRRVEERLRDIPAGPTWADVLARDYRSWDREHLTIDTAAGSVERAVALLMAAVPAR